MPDTQALIRLPRPSDVSAFSDAAQPRGQGVTQVIQFVPDEQLAIELETVRGGKSQNTVQLVGAISLQPPTLPVVLQAVLDQVLVAPAVQAAWYAARLAASKPA